MQVWLQKQFSCFKVWGWAGGGPRSLPPGHTPSESNYYNLNYTMDIIRLLTKEPTQVHQFWRVADKYFSVCPSMRLYIMFWSAQRRLGNRRGRRPGQPLGLGAGGRGASLQP